MVKSRKQMLSQRSGRVLFIVATCESLNYRRFLSVQACSLQLRGVRASQGLLLHPAKAGLRLLGRTGILELPPELSLVVVGLVPVFRVDEKVLQR